MKPKFAFTARYWGNGAVVCRALEDRPGPVVEQQFGEFQTWTQAQAFAIKLNEGLDLEPRDVLQIVTSSLLAAARLFHAAFPSSQSWRNSRVERAARTAQAKCLLAELALARTYCRSAGLVSGDIAERMVCRARSSATRAQQFLTLYAFGNSEIEDISASLTALNAALEASSGPVLHH